MSVSAFTGKRVVITRPPHKAGAFADQLRALGAVPVLAPMIAIQPPPDAAPLDDALRQLDTFNWLVVTSANTVRHLWPRLETLGVAIPSRLKWAAVGPATAKALRKRGVTPDIVPAEHVAEALFAALDDHANLNGAAVLLPQGNLARSVLADSLQAAGARVTTVIAYVTVQPPLDPTLLAEPFDAITFTSSSTVTHFAERFADSAAVLRDALIACIGPVTARTACDLGWPVHVIAEPYTIKGLIAALGRAFERISEA